MSAPRKSAVKTDIERSSLSANITALYALQAANYVIPLLSLPYLIRVLGAEQYGIMAMAYATVYFLVLFVDAGFNTRAIRLLSRADIQHDEITNIYATTQWLKFIQALVGLAVLLLLIKAVPHFHAHAAVYLASYGMVIGSLLFPTWLFQGLQIMHFTTLCSVGGRLLATAGIFLFVRDQGDVVTAAALQASATIISGLLSLPVVARQLQLTVFIPGAQLVAGLRRAVQDGWELSASEYIINATSNAGVFILGLFATESVVGIYAAISKIGQAGVNAFQPLLKALFPMIAQHWIGKASDVAMVARRWTRRILVGAVFFSIALYFASSELLGLLFGVEWKAHGGLLQALALWLLFSISASSIGQFWLLARGDKTRYARCLMLTGILQVTACVFGAYQSGITGLIAALVFSEIARLTFFVLALWVRPPEFSL